MRHGKRNWFSPRGRPWLVVGVAAVLLSLLAAAAWRERRSFVHQRVERWVPAIERTAARWGIDPDLAAAVVEMESGGDPHARSAADARGLMQITPVTLAEVRDRRKVVGAGDLEDPAYNMAVGCAYLAQLQARFAGDKELMLAAYHMGPSRVAKWLTAHPGASGAALVADAAATGPKTRYYVGAVLALWEDRQRERAEKAAAIGSPPAP